MGLLAEKRQQYILDTLRSTGRVYVKDLAQELCVTEVTIRRDLASLQRKALLQKTYGGAIPAAAPEVNVPVRYRQIRNLKPKQIIGRLAGDLVKDGDTIYLEAGSTCYEIIPYLADKKDLTVIVNSLYLMARLQEMTAHKIIIVGGRYRPDRMDMVGPTAETNIAQLGGFNAFTGADDITIDAGISGADVVTVGFARLVLKRASQVIFVGDHTKFDKPALYKIVGIDELDYIVTDTAPSEAWHIAARKKNIRLIYPKDWEQESI